MKVTADATRSGEWWAVSVREVPGAFTQARRLEQVPDMVRDAVALLTDQDASSVEVEVVPHTEFDDMLAVLRESREAAQSAAEQLSAKTREVVLELERRNFTMRDAGKLVGLSPQRVSQLLSKS